MKSLFILFFCFISHMILASDSQREYQYALEIEKHLPVGNSFYLAIAENKFLALYTETKALENQGTAILLHDKGQHPDQKPLIHALRISLPEHNWATLSLQMPVLEFGAKSTEYKALIPEAKQRIQAGIKYLQNNNINNIVLIGYGLGSLAALSFINDQPTVIKACVAISPSVPDPKNPDAEILSYLGSANIPILDIYGSEDISEVTSSARKRRNAAKNNQEFRQFRIPQAGRSFQNHDDLVVKRIYSWLRYINKTH